MEHFSSSDEDEAEKKKMMRDFFKLRHNFENIEIWWSLYWKIGRWIELFWRNHFCQHISSQLIQIWLIYLNLLSAPTFLFLYFTDEVKLILKFWLNPGSNLKKKLRIGRRKIFESWEGNSGKCFGERGGGVDSVIVRFFFVKM